jgi:hypothetical protein
MSSAHHLKSYSYPYTCGGKHKHNSSNPQRMSYQGQWHQGMECVNIWDAFRCMQPEALRGRSKTKRPRQFPSDDWYSHAPSSSTLCCRVADLGRLWACSCSPSGWQPCGS